MNRRVFLKALATLPVLGTLGLFASPLFRYLRPSSGPITDTGLDMSASVWTGWEGKGGLFSKPDMPQRERDIIFDLKDFPKPWSFQTFTFGLKSREYTSQKYQSTNIPGYAVRMPEDKDGRPHFVIVSRVCPHMGCVFNFLPEEKELSAYNYPQAKNPMFACPCHLSVYDPLQEQNVEGKLVAGKVVSGPAPRPPRYFEWKIDGDKLIITNAESGGIS
jgi:Rieske Fe-S protein